MVEDNREKPARRSVDELAMSTIKAFKGTRYTNPETGEPFFVLSAASQVLKEEIEARGSDPRTVTAQLIVESPVQDADRFARKYTEISATEPEDSDLYFHLGATILEQEARLKDPSISRSEDFRYRAWDRQQP